MYSTPQKFQFLRFISEQGIVCLDDLTRYFSLPGKSESIRRALYKMGIAQKKYPGVKHGIWYIDKPELYDVLHAYFPQLPEFTVRSISFPQAYHFLELNKIRTAIEQSNKVVVDEWWSENFIRAISPEAYLDEFSSFIPDAIFWRKRPDNSRQQFYIEYERTLKNRDRYEAIFLAYIKREGVESRNVVYICQNTYIQKALISVEAKLVKKGKMEQAGQYFQFVTLESFYKTYNFQLQNKEESNEKYQTVHEYAQV